MLYFNNMWACELQSSSTQHPCITTTTASALLHPVAPPQVLYINNVWACELQYTEECIATRGYTACRDEGMARHALGETDAYDGSWAAALPGDPLCRVRLVGGCSMRSASGKGKGLP